MPGLERTLSALQNLGWKVAIASGGFTYFAEVLQKNSVWLPSTPTALRLKTAF